MLPETQNAYVYPLPASEVAHLVYFSPTAQEVEIRLFNFTGRLLSTIRDQAQASSSNRRDLPLDGFAPGPYFYVLRGRADGALLGKGKVLVVRP